MIEGVPRELQTIPKLTEFFESLFPGEVYTVTVPSKTPHLERIVDMRRKIMIQIEDFVAEWIGNPSPYVDTQPWLYVQSKCLGRVHDLIFSDLPWRKVNDPFTIQQINIDEPSDVAKLFRRYDENSTWGRRSHELRASLAQDSTFESAATVFQDADHAIKMLHALLSSAQKSEPVIRCRQYKRVDAVTLHCQLLIFMNRAYYRTAGMCHQKMTSVKSDHSQPGTDNSKSLAMVSMAGNMIRKRIRSISKRTSLNGSVISETLLSEEEGLNRAKHIQPSDHFDFGDIYEDSLSFKDSGARGRANSSEILDANGWFSFNDSDFVDQEELNRNLDKRKRNPESEHNLTAELDDILLGNDTPEEAKDVHQGQLSNVFNLVNDAQESSKPLDSTSVEKESHLHNSPYSLQVFLVKISSFFGLHIIGRKTNTILRSVSYRDNGEKDSYWSQAGRKAMATTFEAIRAVELLTIGDPKNNTSTAFVTFTSRVANVSAHQLFLHHKYHQMNIVPAPAPTDIRWGNVVISDSQVKLRTYITQLILLLGLIFWSVIVSAITIASDLDELAKRYKWLKAYKKHTLYILLDEYLAVLLLVILIACLPFLFDVLARSYRGLKQESVIQMFILRWYFYYQLINVFFSMPVVSVSVESALRDIISSPHAFLRILGQNLPHASPYFASFIIVKSFTAVPVELLRVWPMLTVGLGNCLIDRKRCSMRYLRSGIFTNYSMLYGWIYPNLLMVFSIVSVYNCMVPLIAPLGAVYFAFTYVMYKYQLLYVYINEEQGGADNWYSVFAYSMISQICSVLTLLGYIIIQGDTGFTGTKDLVTSASLSYGPVYMLVPLPFLIAYYWHRIYLRYEKTTRSLSLQNAVKKDSEIASASEKRTFLKRNFQEQFYYQRSLAESDILVPEPYRSGTKDEAMRLSSRKQPEPDSAMRTPHSLERQRDESHTFDDTPLSLKKTNITFSDDVLESIV
jgi:hypothetical protein